MSLICKLISVIDEILIGEELEKHDLNYIRKKYSGYYDLDKDQYYPLGDENRFHHDLLTKHFEWESNDKPLLKIKTDVHVNPDSKHEELRVGYNYYHKPNTQDKEKIDRVIGKIVGEAHRDFRHHKVFSEFKPEMSKYV